MNKILTFKAFVVMLLFLTPILGIKHADALEQPYTVFLIGNFIPADEKVNTRTFVLWHEEKEWRFRITKPQIIGPGSPSGWQLLRKIIPRKIHLVGEEKVIQFLYHLNVVGKSYNLKGLLYVQSKKLFLRSAEEILEKDNPPKDE